MVEKWFDITKKGLGGVDLYFHFIFSSVIITIKLELGTTPTEDCES